MESIKNAFKSGYFQFINFLQNLPSVWFVTIWVALFCLSLVCIMKFFKGYDGTQKEFKNVSKIIIAVLLIACLVFLTSVR